MIKPSSRALDYSLQTFGCKVNTYDSGLLQSRLTQSGLTLKGESEVRLHILNTCAVTAEATKESLRRVRQLKERDPLCTVVVTGCAAQVDTQLFIDDSSVDLVVANSHKGQLEEIIQKYMNGEIKEKVFKSNIFKKLDLEGGGGEEKDHTRSFLKIQDGCNSFCTFCVIPFARGRSRSIDIESLVKRVNNLYDKGVREVVLTGVHIGDYSDGENKLEDLVENLLLKTSVPRFRLSSLEPIECSDRLLDLYSNPKMCPHFHLSIQSAQTDVLKAMARKYTAKEVESVFSRISKNVPHAFIGMDIIVGFPGETEEQFYETYNRMKSLPWTKVHVFPYSPRPGVYANKIKGALHRHEILERAKVLRELSFSRYTEKALDQVGTVKEAMVLKGGGRGLSEDYWSLSWPLEDKYFKQGELVPVRVIGYDHSQKSRMNGILMAELVH